MREIDRNAAFCAGVLLPKHPQALVVEDTLQDARSVLLTILKTWTLQNAFSVVQNTWLELYRML